MLTKGYSKKSVARNIRTEIAAGKKPAQAAAIAYQTARTAAKKAGKHPAYLKRGKPK